MRARKTAYVAIAAAGVAVFGPGCDSSAVCPSIDGQAPDAQIADGATADVLSNTSTSDGSEAGNASQVQAPMEAGSTGAPPSTLSTLSRVRFANWSPDAPAVDLCLAPQGTTAFIGPLVASLASSLDAGATALAFPLVSAYVALPPGTYNARIVVAGAGNCAVGIGPDMTTLPALGGNAFATIALLGEALPNGSDPGLQVVGFLDSLSSGGGVSVRFINASPALADVDFGTGAVVHSSSDDAFHSLFDGVSFGAAGKAMPPADAGASPNASGATTDASVSGEAGATPDAAAPPINVNYTTLSTLSSELSAHDPTLGTDAVVTTMAIFAAPGSVLTFVLVGGTSAETTPMPKLIECVDNAGLVGELSNCCGIDFPAGSSMAPCGQ